MLVSKLVKISIPMFISLLSFLVDTFSKPLISNFTSSPLAVPGLPNIPFLSDSTKRSPENVETNSSHVS